MVYYGYTPDEKQPSAEAIDLLKLALRNVPIDQPYRGPNRLELGNLVYGSSRNRVGRTRYYRDVNVLVHVNVNVPGGGVTLAEGIARKAWLQSLSAKASRLDTLPGKHG
jgi:hypothetical protein